MTIKVFPSGPFETNAYIVACSETGSAVVVDPGVESFDRIVDHLEAAGLRPERILLTHSHWDHIGDVAALKEKYGIPVAIHPADAKNLERPGSDGLPCWVKIQGVKTDEELTHGDEIRVGNLRFTVIHTPGHSPGGVCFYDQEHAILLSGDTLFQGSIGNLSFPTASPDAMWASLEILAALPPETVVYPGHGPSTTIGDEEWLPKAKQFFGNS